MKTEQLIEKIDDELILRKAGPEDTEAIANFNAKVHADPGEEFVDHIAAWVTELMSGRHPTTKAEDFILVENTRTGEVISSMCLIGQTWAYEGIQFPVGRLELVGTKEEYRRRGLVRKMFNTLHGWSAERGQVLQVITGIPWFYRQFGYEMGLNLGGRRSGSLDQIPALKKDQQETFHFRPVEEKDLSFITNLYQANSRRNAVSCVWDENNWRYDLFTRNPEATMAFKAEIIETLDGEAAGYFLVRRRLHGISIGTIGFEVRQGISWFEAAHATLRRLKAIGQEMAAQESTEEKKVELARYDFNLGGDHPVYRVIPNRLPKKFDPYAFYVRVPDLPGFLQLISPILEERLAKSDMAGHSCELSLNFYTNGINLTLEKGKITGIEPWQKPKDENYSANFPNLTFLQLLFGYRDIDALDDAYADLYCQNEFATPLLKAMFPKKPSYVFELP